MHIPAQRLAAVRPAAVAAAILTHCLLRTGQHTTDLQVRYKQSAGQEGKQGQLLGSCSASLLKTRSHTNSRHVHGKPCNGAKGMAAPCSWAPALTAPLQSSHAGFLTHTNLPHPQTCPCSPWLQLSRYKHVVLLCIISKPTSTATSSSGCCTSPAAAAAATPLPAKLMARTLGS